MPVTYNIVPIPLWYFADNEGRPLGGGYMTTWRSVDKVTPKPIYTDASGQFAWPNPVYFNANGEAPGMFFWADDEPYFVIVYASDGTQLFNVDNYGPGIAGGGGGGTVTTNNFLANYVINNLFLQQGGTSVVAGINTFSNIQSGTVIAPSCHEGFVKVSTGFSTIPYAGPDIMFVRSNDSSTDNLKFAKADFDAGTNPLTGDITPEYYVQLTCTAAGNETLKAIQWPIDLHVKNLEQQPVSGIVWAKSNSGTPSLLMNLVQYFGTGSATTPVVTPIPINAGTLVGSWVAYSGVLNTIPSVAGKTLGSGGDDATYLQICFPTAQTFDISFTKPKLYLGTVTVFPELQSYDFVNTNVNSPRTGDIRTSLNAHAPFGWVAANNGTIGSASSTSSNIARANIDTWPLYSLIWNGVTDHWAPVAGGRGASAIADFSANKAMTLTKNLGRVLAGMNPLFTTSMTFTANYLIATFTVSSTSQLPTGTPVVVSNSGGALPTPLTENTVYYVINTGATTFQLAISVDYAQDSAAITLLDNGTGTHTVLPALGAAIGQGAHVLIQDELPDVNLNMSDVPVWQVGTNANGVIAVGDHLNQKGTANNASNVIPLGGGDVPHNTMQPTTFMNVFIKL